MHVFVNRPHLFFSRSDPVSVLVRGWLKPLEPVVLTLKRPLEQVALMLKRASRNQAPLGMFSAALSKSPPSHPESPSIFPLLHCPSPSHACCVNLLHIQLFHVSAAKQIALCNSGTSSAKYDCPRRRFSPSPG